MAVSQKSRPYRKYAFIAVTGVVAAAVILTAILVGMYLFTQGQKDILRVWKDNKVVECTYNALYMHTSTYDCNCRIDSCSSLLVGLPLDTLARLDRVLRSAARLVGRLHKFSPITAYMRDVGYYIGCLSLSIYNIVLPGMLTRT